MITHTRNPVFQISDSHFSIKQLIYRVIPPKNTSQIIPLRIPDYPTRDTILSRAGYQIIPPGISDHPAWETKLSHLGYPTIPPGIPMQWPWSTNLKVVGFPILLLESHLGSQVGSRSEIPPWDPTWGPTWDPTPAPGWDPDENFTWAREKKCKSIIFPFKAWRKIQEWQTRPSQLYLQFTWKCPSRFLWYLAHTLQDLSSLYLSNFVMKCLTGMRDNWPFSKWATMGYCCYGNMVPWKLVRKQTLFICRKDVVVSRKWKLVFYRKCRFQQVHPKAKKPDASLLNTMFL